MGIATRAIAELSIDTQTLERALLIIPVGGVVSYSELSGLIGRDVQDDASHNLSSARHRVQRDHAMCFEPVRGSGLKRLSDESIVGTVAAAFGRVRNIARRGRNRLACVQDFDALPNDLKVRHNLAASIFGVLSHVTKESSAKKLEAGVANGKHDAMPVRRFLDAMKETL